MICKRCGVKIPDTAINPMNAGYMVYEQGVVHRFGYDISITCEKGALCETCTPDFEKWLKESKTPYLRVIEYLEKHHNYSVDKIVQDLENDGMKKSVAIEILREMCDRGDIALHIADDGCVEAELDGLLHP